VVADVLEGAEDANPWLWTGIGLVLVAVGSVWLYKRVQRDGFHPRI
jgi:hypothetical protein